ncbi:hypothetical protein T492DRAFT_913428 [Pavlovales sp. CCMP2436]|nr:hypothetical protein T492DRAFT_913428 [Pavlovales sp. CCMP2436]
MTAMTAKRRFPTLTAQPKYHRMISQSGKKYKIPNPWIIYPALFVALMLFKTGQRGGRRMARRTS